MTHQRICSSDVLLQYFIFTNSMQDSGSAHGDGGSVYGFVALCVSDPANDKVSL